MTASLRVFWEMGQQQQQPDQVTEPADIQQLKAGSIKDQKLAQIMDKFGPSASVPFSLSWLLYPLLKILILLIYIVSHV